jgi:hypothetical protein
MVATIVLNASNIVPNGQNNQLVYSFPNSVAFPNHEIAIQSVSLYYSWVNINATTLNNNQYQFIFPPAGDTPYTVVMPDGLYEIATINQYLQFYCIQNGLYLITSTGSFVYFLEWTVNTSLYAVQLNLYPIPTSATATTLGYTQPDNATWSYPATAVIPLVYLSASTLPANNFYKIVGFPQAFNMAIAPYEPADSTINTSYVSTTAPQVNPNPTLYIAISNIENNMATPSSIIGTISPTVNYGELINITPPQFAWNKLLSGTYNSLRISILGTDKQPVIILDPTMTLTLVIRDKKDISLTDALNTASMGK